MDLNWGAGLVAAVVLAGVAAVVPARADEPLKVGDKSPDFKLMGTDGKVHTLSEYRGKSAVVIAWYPMALTGG